MSTVQWAVLGACGLAAVCLLVVAAPLLALHLESRAAGARVAMIELIGMRLRQVDARAVVRARLRAVKAGLGISTIALETHTLAGGDAGAVVDALIEARQRGMALTWMQAAAYDLAGRDVRAAVRAGVQPLVGVADNVPRGGQPRRRP